MRAVVFHSPGLENLRLEDLPKPQPGPGEVLVRVKYVGVNPIDHAVVSGSHKASPMPHIPGCEFAGVVEEVGPGVSGGAKPCVGLVAIPRDSGRSRVRIPAGASARFSSTKSGRGLHFIPDATNDMHPGGLRRGAG
jgi:NADPH:quinone reductase-like Zn-dependent oxidoreductase